MSQYQLVFSGELVEGKTRAQIEPIIIKTLKLSDNAVNTLFQASTKPVVLKRVSSLEDANNLCGKFRKLGLVLDIKQAKSKLKCEKQRAPKTPKLSLQAIDKPIAPKTPDLSLQPLKKTVTKINQPPNASEEHEETKAEDNKLISGLNLIKSILQPTILMVIIGLYISINYFPYPDGFLRNGFVVGMLVLSFGIVRLKRRFN